MIGIKPGFVAVLHLVMGHRPQAGLMGHDDSPFAAALAGRQSAALDHVFDAHGLVVDGGDNQGTDFAQAAFLLAPQNAGGLRRVGHPQHLADRVLAAAEEAHAADGHGHVALLDVVATHRGVAVGQRGLQLGQA